MDLVHIFFPVFFWSCITGLRIEEYFWCFIFYCFSDLCYCLLNIHVKIVLWVFWGLNKIAMQFRSVCGVILPLFSVRFSFVLTLDQVLSVLRLWLVSFPQNLPTLLGQCTNNKTILFAPSTKTLVHWLSNRKSIALTPPEELGKHLWPNVLFF